MCMYKPPCPHVLVSDPHLASAAMHTGLASCASSTCFCGTRPSFTFAVPEHTLGSSFCSTRLCKLYVCGGCTLFVSTCPAPLTLPVCSWGLQACQTSQIERSAGCPQLHDMRVCSILHAYNMCVSTPSRRMIIARMTLVCVLYSPSLCCSPECSRMCAGLPNQALEVMDGSSDIPCILCSQSVADLCEPMVPVACGLVPLRHSLHRGELFALPLDRMIHISSDHVWCGGACCATFLVCRAGIWTSALCLWSQQ